MSASLTLDGAKEMAAVLEGLPDELTRNEFAPIVVGAAQNLSADLKSSYARVTGTLADRVTVEAKEPLRARVRSRAPHAHLYEYGTVRRSTNQTGANRGTMPAQPTFVPAAMRWRLRMVEHVKDAMRRLKIPGFSGTAEVRES